MKTFIRLIADKFVRNPRQRAVRPPELAGSNCDAVAYAAALEVLG